MPLLVTHTFIGLVVKQVGFKSIFHKRWKTLVFIAVFASLPDIIDFPLGFIFTGNGNAYHYRFTHTIYFALAGGLGGVFFLSLFQKMSWSSWQSRWVNFFFCFLLISSHSLADFISTNQIASFFYPGGVNLLARHLGFPGFLKMFVNYNFQEVKITVGCVAAIAFIQLLKFTYKKCRVSGFVLRLSILKK